MRSIGLTGLVTSAEAVASNLNQGRGTLSDGRSCSRAVLEASLENLQAVTARIRAGEGSLGKLLNDESVAASMKSAAANLDSFTGRINRGEGTLGQLAASRGYATDWARCQTGLIKSLPRCSRARARLASCSATSSCMRT